MCTNNVWILAFVLLCSNNLRRSDLRRWIKLLEMKNWWFLTSCCCTTLLHQMNGDNVEILMFLFFFVLSAMWHLIPELCYSTRHTLFIVTLFTTITFMYQPEWDPPSSLSPVYLNLRSKLRLNKYWLHKHTFQLPLNISSNPHKKKQRLVWFWFLSLLLPTQFITSFKIKCIDNGTKLKMICFILEHFQQLYYLFLEAFVWRQMLEHYCGVTKTSSSQFYLNCNV